MLRSVPNTTPVTYQSSASMAPAVAPKPKTRDAFSRQGPSLKQVIKAGTLMALAAPVASRPLEARYLRPFPDFVATNNCARSDVSVTFGPNGPSAVLTPGQSLVGPSSGWVEATAEHVVSACFVLDGSGPTCLETSNGIYSAGLGDYYDTPGTLVVENCVAELIIRPIPLEDNKPGR